MNLLSAFTGVFSSPSYSAALAGFWATLGMCVLLVLTKRWHGALTMDHTEGVQKFHTEPTPRIGGVPILLGLVVAWGKSPQDVKDLLTLILIPGLPAFLCGLAEDMTKRVGVTPRLLATLVSGLLACLISDYSLTRVDVWGLDRLLQYTLISLAFTAFAVAGVANSINIIDGLNGLSSTMSTLAFIGFGMIAYQVSDHALLGLTFVLAACIWGFWALNWPFGKIFLGDGGSYFIGFALSWVAIMLINRNPEVSAFVPLVICAHPITEVLYSIYRRHCKDSHPGKPDRLHLHSLIKQRYVRRWFGHFSDRIRNSIAGFGIGLFTIIPIFLANLVYSSVKWSAITYVGLVFVYVFIYLRVVRHRWS